MRRIIDLIEILSRFISTRRIGIHQYEIGLYSNFLTGRVADIPSASLLIEVLKDGIPCLGIRGLSGYGAKGF